MCSGERQYEVFISYYRDTGSPLADHLKKGLEKVGISAFVDRFDIPDTIKRDDDEWRSYVDKAILECKLFVLVMTFGFNTSKEIERELKLAIENDVDRLNCKHNDLPDNQKMINIDGKKVDLSKYTYKPFSDAHDLLRKVGAVLFGSISEDTASLFLTKAYSIFNSEGSEIRRTDSFLVDIVVGPYVESTEWLSPTSLNAWLVGCSPYRVIRVTPRTKYYDVKTGTGEFYRVRTSGFFHAITPIDFYESHGFYFVSHIIQAILDLFIFSIRLMKAKGIASEQGMAIVLRNISESVISYDSQSRYPKLTFSSETTEFNFPTYTFNPTNDWSEIAKIFTKIFRDLHIELGYVTITDETLNKWIIEQLRVMRELFGSYTNSQFPGTIIPKIDLNEFNLNN